MPRSIRRFKDSQGTAWSVRVERRLDVILALGPGGQSSRDDREWLYFRSPTVTRRVDTFPPEWHDLDAAELETLLRRATKAPA